MEKWLAYLSFSGRANRKQFWLRALALFGLYVLSIVLAVIARIVPLLAVIPLLGILVLAVANLANAARRLHDRNKSAWWLLLFSGVPILLSVFGFAARMAAKGNAAAAALAGLFTLIELPIAIWALVELGFLPGTKGVNKYGEDPLSPPMVEVFS